MMAPKAPERIGQYQILELLGKGGMASVYKAIQPSLNRLVAIKVLPPEFALDPERVQRFHREAQAVALLNHPNIVHIIDKDQDGETLYFVMEYVEGTSLGVVLFQRRLSLAEVLHIAKEIGKALEYAHRSKVVHRDLKPGNILVSPDLSVVKLADFGISRIDPQGDDSRTLTTTQTSLGTMHYCAPEQIETPKNVDHRADVYSLGVICYEMLTGRVPLGKFRLPSQVNEQLPAELDQIVLRCLASEAADRYQNVGQVLVDIENLEKTTGFRLVAELKLLSQSTSRLILKSTTRLTKGRSRPTYAAAAGFLVVLLVALLVARRFMSVVPALPATGEQTAVERAATVNASSPPVPPAESAPQQPATIRTASGGTQVQSGDLGAALPPAAATQAPTPLPAAAAKDPVPAAAAGGGLAAARSPGTEAPNAASAAAPAPRAATARPEKARPTREKDLEIARSKADAGLFDQALTDVQSILNDPNAAPIAPDAYLLMASIHERRGRLDDARAVLVEMTGRHGDDPRVGEALLKLAQLTLKGKDGERNARNLLVQMLEHVQSGPAVLPAFMEKARLEERLRLAERDPVLMIPVPSALITYRKVAESHPAAPEAELSLWKMGEMLDDLKRYPAAAQAYVDLGTHFPQTRYDAWYRAGELFERRLKDNVRARDAYLRVPPTSERYRDAQRRAERIAPQKGD